MPACGTFPSVPSKPRYCVRALYKSRCCADSVSLFDVWDRKRKRPVICSRSTRYEDCEAHIDQLVQVAS